jgi:hypothetical protein
MKRRRRNAMTPAQARKQRAALLRDIAREHKLGNRRKLVELRQRLRDAKAERRRAIVQARTDCRSRRPAMTLKQIREKHRLEVQTARTACATDLAKARAISDRVKRARVELHAERTHQRAIRRIERANRQREQQAKRPGLARVRRGESDDEVRGNIPPELVPLFDRVKGSIRGSDRMSRTEAFLKYAEEHPDEQYEVLEARTDALIRELEARERRSAHANPSRGGRLHLQSLLFERPRWDVSKAKAWARSHVCEIAGRRIRCRAGTAELTTAHVRLRQRDPCEFAPGSFRTVPLGQGVKAIMGHKHK